MNSGFTINSEFTLQAAQAELARQWNKKKWLQISFNFDKFRTIPQNSSLHLYCSHLSVAFNDAGYDMTKVLAHHADIPWDKKGINVKERVWRPVQETLCQKKSTAKLSTQECIQVYETVNRFTASRMGVSVDWPSKDNK